MPSKIHLPFSPIFHVTEQHFSNYLDLGDIYDCLTQCRNVIKSEAKYNSSKCGHERCAGNGIKNAIHFQNMHSQCFVVNQNERPSVYSTNRRESPGASSNISCSFADEILSRASNRPFPFNPFLLFSHLH